MGITGSVLQRGLRGWVSSFKHTRICPKTPYMHILCKCVNKANSVFPQIILQADGKCNVKDKTMPLKTLSLNILSSVSFKKWIIKIIFKMKY